MEKDSSHLNPVPFFSHLWDRGGGPAASMRACGLLGHGVPSQLEEGLQDLDVGEEPWPIGKAEQLKDPSRDPVGGDPLAETQPSLTPLAETFCF